MTTFRFKVGDLARIKSGLDLVKPRGGSAYGFEVGRIFKVLEEYVGAGGTGIAIEEKGTYVPAQWFDKIDPKTLTKLEKTIWEIE